MNFSTMEEVLSFMTKRRLRNTKISAAINLMFCVIWTLLAVLADSGWVLVLDIVLVIASAAAFAHDIRMIRQLAKVLKEEF